MKNLGFVRKVDNLGRITIPKEMREVLHIGIGTPIEFYADNELMRSKFRREVTLAKCGEQSEGEGKIHPACLPAKQSLQLTTKPFCELK